MMKIFNFFQKKRPDKNIPTIGSNEFSSELQKIHNNYEKYYKHKDLVYFPDINAHIAFKYDVVNDIFLNRKEIGVSDLHLALNDIYFSQNESKHLNHKKLAIKQLEFLSKKLQFSDSDFTNKLYSILVDNFPKNKPFQLEYYLVNPILFLNAFYEFGILEIFPEFDPENDDFNIDRIIHQVNEFFRDMDYLVNLFKNHFDNGGEIPSKVKPFLLHIYESYNGENKSLRYAHFFKSMIFSAVDSTTSLLRSMIYMIMTKYEGILEQGDNEKKLYAIADEVLRIYTPVPFVFRTVREDITYGNQKLKKGDLIILSVYAANNDSSVFYKPDDFLLNRNQKHLSYGRGAYACIGESMSYRLTMNVLKYLQRDIKKIELVDKQAKHNIENSMLKIPLKVIFHDTKR